MLRLIQSGLCAMGLVLAGCIYMPLPELSCRYTVFGPICSPTRAPIEGAPKEFLAEPALTRETVLLRLGEPDVILENGTAYLYYWRMEAGIVGLLWPSVPVPLYRRHALLFLFDAQGVMERTEKEEWYGWDIYWQEIQQWAEEQIQKPPSEASSL